MIYLASQSPRRQELLQQIGIPFQQLVSEIDETPGGDEAPGDYVCRMAGEKARAGWVEVQARGLPEIPLLAADTSVVMGSKILGKPNNPEQACDMLLSLSGNCHAVMTAIAVTNGHKTIVRLSTTQVQMTPFDRLRAEAYVATGEPADKAGAYGIQGYGAILVESIRGSYSGVVGLPLQETADVLSEFGITPWHSL
ncbi:Maf family nucleotide pyrophosphatase [Endozoicomonas gorgoniicola]|uniref:dTTP/UTP pyrophosphatase n=1 Tax=Endozoicomonas gorgoniicola TaxID=1234144 RepID=A0ABT3MXM6_9GAMM|nr:nucleoside triphosphate pyrophosphatase [Endozoicomonas gorgoniicola]MCW7554110.1 Maf family nucleotide pyrophosphatase [Endozoicomonas gorgoniicola]